MTDENVEFLVRGCLSYIAQSKLPKPLPADPQQYEEWSARAAEAQRVDDEDAEDA